AWRDGSLIPARGLYGWAGHIDYVSKEKQSVKVTKSRTPPAYLDGAFYVGLEEDGAFGLVRLDRAEKLSGKPTRAWFARSKNPVSLSAAAGEGAVFFVDGRPGGQSAAGNLKRGGAGRQERPGPPGKLPGDEGRALRCLDPETGEERWRHAVGTGGSGAFIIVEDRIMEDRLLIADTAEGLTCLDTAQPSEERELWKAEVGPCVGVPVPVADMVVVAVKSPPHLAALDSREGLPLWKETLPAEPQTGPVHAGGRVWVGLPEGLFGASLLSGKE
ncbi:unnamed protein product, partial [marine sediment metagenome]